MKTEKHKEQQNVEWKAEWKEEYLKWICGFANAQGGKIYIGKDDKGETVGVKNAKKLLNSSAGPIVRGHFWPFITGSHTVKRTPPRILNLRA